MANRRLKTALSAEEIASTLEMLDEDDDNMSDLELDGLESQEEQVEEVIEVIFNAAGEVIERIGPRYIIQSISVLLSTGTHLSALFCFFYISSWSVSNLLR